MAAESSKHSFSEQKRKSTIYIVSVCFLWISLLSICSAYLIYRLGYAENDAIFQPAKSTDSWSFLPMWYKSKEPPPLAALPYYPRRTFEIYIQCIGYLFSTIDFISDNVHSIVIVIAGIVSSYGWIGLCSLKELTCFIGHKVISQVQYHYEQATRSPLSILMEKYDIPVMSLIIGFTCLGAVLFAFFLVIYMKKKLAVHNKRQKHYSRKTQLTYTKNKSYNKKKLVLNLVQAVFIIVSLCVTLSVPWEFIRLYQHMVAKNAAIASMGVPAECIPQSMSLWQSIRAWCVWQFSWNSRPCEEYHRAVLVDPLWEITPMMVLTSALTRCVTRPVQLISEALGISIKLLYSHIPLPWQPVVMVTTTIVLILLILTCFRYRLHLPFLFRLEPGENQCKNCTTKTAPKPLPPYFKDAHFKPVTDNSNCKAGRDVKSIMPSSKHIKSPLRKCSSLESIPVKQDESEDINDSLFTKDDSCISYESSYNDMDDFLNDIDEDQVLAPTVDELSLYERMNVSTFGY